MATGTGLPIPKSGAVLAEAPGRTISVDGGAGDWTRIAAAGEKIADLGMDWAKRDEALLRAGTQASFDNDFRQKEAAAYEQYATGPNGPDPKGYQSWANGAMQGAMQGVPRWMVPHAQQFIGQQTDSGYNRLLGQKMGTDRALAIDALKSRLATADDDTIVAFSQGLGGQAPGKKAAATYNGVLDEMVAARTMSPEHASLLREDLAVRANIAHVRYGLEQKFAQEGMPAARTYLDEQIKGMTDVAPKVKDKVMMEGLRWLRTQDAALKGEKEALTKQWQAAKPDVAKLPPADMLDMARQADTLGLTGVATDIRTSLAAAKIAADVRGLPTGQQVEVLATGRMPAPVATAINEAAQATGVPTSYLSRTISKESGGNVNAQNPNSSAGGLGQFTDGTWSAMLQRHGAKYGLGPNTPKSDPRASALMTAEYAKENAATLQQAGLPATDANLYVAHFAGPRGAVQLLTADPAARAANILPAAAASNRTIFYNPDGSTRTVGQVLARLESGGGGGGGGSGVALTQSREGLMAQRMIRAELAASATAQLKELDAAERRLQVPSVEEISALGAQLAVVGTPEQQRRVAELMAKAEFGEKFRTLSGAQREQVIAEMAARNKDGGDRLLRELETMVRAENEKITDGYKTDKYGTAYRVMAGMDPLPAADPTQASFGDIIRSKVAQQNTINAAERLPASTVFRPTEGVAVASSLVGGPAAQASAVLGLLASELPNEMYRATIGSKPMKDALDGMVRSYDPARLNAAMTTLDRYWQLDPVGFKSTFHEETLKRLQVWQTWRNSASPAEIAERFKRADDPASTAVREKMKEEGADELKKVKVDDVVTAMGTSFGITPSFISRNITGSDPLPPVDTSAVPVDGVQSRRLLWEYGEIYKDFRSMGLDADQARKQAGERLKTEWGPSAMTGGALMRFRPENYFPAVDGSYDWMKKQATEFTASVRGPEYAGGLAVPGQVQTPNWRFKTIMADAQTEAEISAGKKPSYLLIVTDGRTGRDELVSDPTTGRRRFTFDPTTEQVASEARFRARREGIRELLGDGGGLDATTPPPANAAPQAPLPAQGITGGVF